MVLPLEHMKDGGESGVSKGALSEQIVVASSWKFTIFPKLIQTQYDLLPRHCEPAPSRGDESPFGKGRISKLRNSEAISVCMSPPWRDVI